MGTRTAAILLMFPLLAGLTAPAAFPAGTARLLVDANPGPPDLTGSFGYAPPSQFAELEGRAVFLVDSYDPYSGGYRPTAGPQVTLWASDGTAGGTELLATFCKDGVESCHQQARLLGQTGGVVFLEIPEVGYDNYFHRELWRTDGTVDGTYRLPPELCPNGQSLGATEVIAGGALYFAGLDASTGCEPWVSDGTPAGTELLADLQPGTPDSSGPQGFAAIGNRVYFTSLSGGLWGTDGTPGGTALVHLFDPLQLVTSVGGRLFFMVPQGFELSLWTSDGTAAGTRFVRSFPAITCRDCDPATTFLKPDGDGVLFLTGDGRHGRKLWHSDGTPGGTRLLTALRTGARFGLNGFDSPADLVDLGPSLLFTVSTKGHNRLWVSRPPAAPAVSLTGCPGGCPEVDSRLHAVPGSPRVVFAGLGRRSGLELWTSDGTAAGTRLVRDLCPGPCDSGPQDFITLGGAVYFSTADAGGGKLWRTDGTAAGTVLLGRTSLPLAVAGGIVLNGRVLLGAADGARASELWATGGTAATTERLKTFSRAPAPSSNPRFAALGGRVVFTTEAGEGSAIWASDGRTTPKLISRPAACDPPCESFTAPVSAGGLAFTFAGLATDGGAFNAHLVRTDGTPEGTRQIHDFGSGSLILHPFAFGGRLLFLRCGVSPDDSNRTACHLWASDGTAEGTVPFAALPHSVFVGPPVVIGAHFYLFVDTGATTLLYRSDGTPAGTQPLASVGPQAYYPLEIAEAGGEVYVAVNGAVERLDPTVPDGVSFFFGTNVTGITELNGRLLFFGASAEDSPRTGLWSTDGTLAGTGLLAPVLEQTLQLTLGTFGPPLSIRLGARLLFRGWDPEHGFELWATDGTPAGTFLVEDIAPGKGSSFPDSLTLAGGEIWFTANDGVHGDELWVSDGTPAGTRLALDLAPGPSSSSLQGLTLAGANLFFSADLAGKGREPWVLPLQ
jgi:ELWxxDGT repeat protein